MQSGLAVQLEGLLKSTDYSFFFSNDAGEMIQLQQQGLAC
jgi:hypothetical protein